jgi:hypothetical protein
MGVEAYGDKRPQRKRRAEKIVGKMLLPEPFLVIPAKAGIPLS